MWHKSDGLSVFCQVLILTAWIKKSKVAEFFKLRVREFDIQKYNSELFSLNVNLCLGK